VRIRDDIGILGYWDIGILGYWDIGILGYWDIGYWDILFQADVGLQLFNICDIFLKFIDYYFYYKI
jgi:hypothetical protein